MATKPATATLSSASDAELLERIARRHDRDAFTEIYARYEKSAYNLAQFLTRNTDFAEEAVQEGFLAVWRSANTFRSDGSPRSWVLRIVAMKSLQILRRRRRNEAKIERAQQEAAPMDADPLAANAEHGEVLASLRRHLERLPDLERELIALYYGGDLSQAQIAEQLEMPERTVSFRIQKALEQLRTRLAGAGFTAALPLAGAEFSGELLRGALLEAGPSVPAGLGASIASQLAAKAAKVSKASARAAAGSSSAGVYVAAAVLLAAGAGTFAWMQSEPKAPQTKAPLEAKTEASAQPAPPTPKETPLIDQRWSFAKGAPADLKPLFGTWAWGKAPDGSGEMQPGWSPGLPPEERRVMVGLPHEFGARPVLVEARGRITNIDSSSYDLIWTDALGNPSPFRRFGQIVHLKTFEVDLRVIVKDRYIELFTNGVLFSVFEFPEPHPAKHLALLFSNFNPREVRVRELREDAPELREFHPEEDFKKLKLAPQSWRSANPDIPPPKPQ